MSKKNALGLYIKNRVKLLWYYTETRYTKLLHIFGVERDSSVIPEGMYCYVNEPRADGGYWIKICKYHKCTPETKGIACTYIGFYGFDCCLYDQCKICGVNDGLDERDLEL
jgi:hypothetical protein